MSSRSTDCYETCTTSNTSTALENKGIKETINSNNYPYMTSEIQVMDLVYAYSVST
jgi:hypothetical protein